jgi:endonuclease/exonuclease/phosphatase (EEP) superfamily protein YafD
MSRDNFGKALCLGGIAVAIAGLVASYLSWFWVEFDVLSHFTLHFCLVIAALGLAVFASKAVRVPVVLVVMVAGIIGIGSWSKLSVDHLPTDFRLPDGSRVLKIVHFNTWGRNGQIEDVATEIGRLDPDLVFLTEMGRDRQALQELLQARFAYRLPEKRPPGTNLQMYSKYPFSGSVVQRRREGPPFIRATLGPEWHLLNIVGTHLTRPIAIIDQEREIRAISALVGNLEGESIVVGDFNATPFSVMLAFLQSRTGLRRATSLPTWPAFAPHLPQFAIDHIFISDGLSLAGPVIVGRNAGSDHLPIAAAIVVPAN